MKVILIFPIAHADTAAGRNALALLDGLRSRSIKAHVVLPEEGDGSMVGELEKRKVESSVIRYTWWTADGDAATSMETRAFYTANKRWNKSAEGDLARLIEEQKARLVIVCSGCIKAGIKAAHKAKVRALWFIEAPFDGANGHYAFIESPSKVASLMGKAERVIAADDETAAFLKGIAPKLSGVRIVAPDDADALYTAIREIQAGV